MAFPNPFSSGTPRVIGYGICGPGESKRYLRETLDEFERLCDEVIILCNNAGPSEEKMIRRYGFKVRNDEREWGRLQWKIKQDFVEQHVAPLAKKGDVMVCLDMDERFDRHLTKEWLQQMPFDAYKVFIIDLWNDEDHYRPKASFWNCRIWRWNGITEWTPKPLHCGLAPRWAAGYNRYAPFLLIHKGLMRKKDRERKIERYKKYDPRAQHLGKAHYYHMLESDAAEPFDEEILHATIEKEVSTYIQSKPRSLPLMATPKGRYAYVRNPGGITVDIPEKQLAETIKRPGFTFLGWADEAEKEMEEMFGEEATAENVSPNPEGRLLDTSGRRRAGSYQRSTADEARELEALKNGDAEEIAPGIIGKNRLGMHEQERIRQSRKAGKVVPSKKPAAPGKKKAAKKRR